MPAGIVATAEDLYYDPHLHARNMVVTVDHTEAGRVEHAGVNVHLSATPGDAARPTPAKGATTTSSRRCSGWTAPSATA